MCCFESRFFKMMKMWGCLLNKFCMMWLCYFWCILTKSVMYMFTIHNDLYEFFLYYFCWFLKKNVRVPNQKLIVTIFLYFRRFEIKIVCFWEQITLFLIKMEEFPIEMCCFESRFFKMIEMWGCLLNKFCMMWLCYFWCILTKTVMYMYTIHNDLYEFFLYYFCWFLIKNVRVPNQKFIVTIFLYFRRFEMKIVCFWEQITLFLIKMEEFSIQMCCF